MRAGYGINVIKMNQFLMDKQISGTAVRIRELKKTHNFRRINKEIGEDNLRNFLAYLYPHYDITEIERITGIPDSTLLYWFKKLNIPITRRHIANITLPASTESVIVVDLGEGAKKISTIKITPELAYLIGFVLGDGSVQRYMVEVFNKDKKLRAHLFEFLKSYGSITEDERANGLWRLRLSSVKVANLIKNENGIRKDTLNYIFNNNELAKKFIAALWDAEGSVLASEKSYYHICLYNSNKYILNKVENFLTSNNIKFSKVDLKPRVEDYFLNGRQIIPRKTVQRINIFKSSFSKWAKEIGVNLLHSKKSKTVEEILKSYGGNQNE